MVVFVAWRKVNTQGYLSCGVSPELPKVGWVLEELHGQLASLAD